MIFDCDGVLVDSETISNTVLARTLTEAGLPTTLEEALRDYKGRTLGEVQKGAEQKLGRPLPADWLTRFREQRIAAFKRDLQPVRGAADAVRSVSDAGIAVCVASQGELDKTELTLRLTGLRPLFGAGALFSAQMVPRGKPDPDLLLHACAVMGAEPGQCVVVEDSPLGVTAAVSARMRVIGYAAEASDVELREAGADVVDSMEEVPSAARDRLTDTARPWSHAVLPASPAPANTASQQHDRPHRCQPG